MRSLYLIRGIPGSGKSTLAGFLTSQLGQYKARAFSSDDYMINEKGEYEYNKDRLPQTHGKCQMNAELAMIDGVENIFIHNTLTQEWELEIYYELAEKYHYRVFSLIVENRHDNSSVHGVPAEAVERFRQKMKVKI